MNKLTSLLYFLVSTNNKIADKNCMSAHVETSFWNSGSVQYQLLMRVILVIEISTL